MDKKTQRVRDEESRVAFQSVSGREFERLYRDSYKVVYNYVRYRMSDGVATKCVVAEAFLRASRLFGSFDPEHADFATWVEEIAVDCMASYWSKERSGILLENASGGHSSITSSIREIDNRCVVDQMLAALSQEERELIAMKYREGYRNVDIAAKLGMNPSTVSTKLSRALKKMRVASEGE